jgi:hypothetical protein
MTPFRSSAASRLRSYDRGERKPPGIALQDEGRERASPGQRRRLRSRAGSAAGDGHPASGARNPAGAGPSRDGGSERFPDLRGERAGRRRREPCENRPATGDAAADGAPARPRRVRPLRAGAAHRRLLHDACRRRARCLPRPRADAVAGDLVDRLLACSDGGDRPCAHGSRLGLGPGAAIARAAGGERDGAPRSQLSLRHPLGGSRRSRGPISPATCSARRSPSCSPWAGQAR